MSIGAPLRILLGGGVSPRNPGQCFQGPSSFNGKTSQREGSARPIPPRHVSLVANTTKWTEAAALAEKQQINTAFKKFPFPFFTKLWEKCHV